MISRNMKNLIHIQKHLRCTIVDPNSSYSSRVIHIRWKLGSEPKIDPPNQTEIFLTGGAIILIFVFEGAKAAISFVIRSTIPGNIVVPPDNTIFPQRSFLMSMSHFVMELLRVS